MFHSKSIQLFSLTNVAVSYQMICRMLRKTIINSFIYSEAHNSKSSIENVRLVSKYVCDAQFQKCLTTEDFPVIPISKINTVKNRTIVQYLVSAHIQ